MTKLTLRLLDSQIEVLHRLLFRDENESAALALCGRSLVADPWLGGSNECFVVREIIEVPEAAYESRSPTGFEWSTTPFYNALKRCEAKDFAVAVFHSHPLGVDEFSNRDDLADKELFQIAFNRLESRRPHVAAIMTPDMRFAARAYGPDLKPMHVDVFSVGERWRYGGDHETGASIDEFDRQNRAFGRAATGQIGKLRFGIVGCGGTGSAVASLLVRLGARQVVLIDPDTVELSNLNRLHFSTQRDANLKRLKVEVVAEAMADIGTRTCVARVPRNVATAEALSALRACDIIFGCTDDHLGREILNRIAHFYFIPVIDLGLLIEPNDAGGYDTFDGRVTVVQPGYPCQSCRGLIDGDQLYLDSLRLDPDLFEERRKAGYVPNDPDPSPAVVTFTTEVATMAVNEMIHRLNGFRGSLERCSERVRQFQYLKDSDLTPGGSSREDCKICGLRAYDGRGDMKPLLNLTL